MRFRVLRALFICAILFQTGISAFAQAWPEYERYRQVSQQNASDELRDLAKEWSVSLVPRQRHLGLLSSATAELRAEDYRAALSLLDSIRAVVPVTEIAIRSTAQRLMASALTLLGDPERGIQAAEDGLALLPAKGFSREWIGLLNVKAEAILYMPNGLAEAYVHFARNAHLADSVGFVLGQGGSENGMGLIRLNQARYDEAWGHFRQMLELGREAGSEMLMQNAVGNLSITATMAGNYQQALRLCDSLLSELGERSPEFRMMLHDEKGVGYRRTGEYDKALNEFKQALELVDPSAETIHQAKLMQSIAITYWRSGRRSEALHTMSEVLKAADRLHMPDLLSEAHLELHDWYVEQGRSAEALEHLQAHMALNDSLARSRYDKELARAEALYGSEKKERRIIEQDLALTFAAEQDRRKSLQRNAFIGATVLLAFIAILLFRSVRNRQRLAKKQVELHNEQVDRLLSQQEMASMNAMLEGQEKERDRVAKELHDRLGSMLGGIKAQLGALEERVEQVNHDAQFLKVNRLLDETVGELRQISHDMAASTLNRFGLVKALNDLRETVHINGRLDVELSLFGLDQHMDRGLEITIYRIVQELVSNVLKHANARELSIAVTRGPGRISVIVSDDGRGFDPTAAVDGIGLSNVRARAAAMGAQVTVNSAPSKGTTVSIEGPVVE